MCGICSFLQSAQGLIVDLRDDEEADADRPRLRYSSPAAAKINMPISVTTKTAAMTPPGPLRNQATTAARCSSTCLRNLSSSATSVSFADRAHGDLDDPLAGDLGRCVYSDVDHGRFGTEVDMTGNSLGGGLVEVLDLQVCGRHRFDGRPSNGRKIIMFVAEPGYVDSAVVGSRLAVSVRIRARASGPVAAVRRTLRAANRTRRR